MSEYDQALEDVRQIVQGEPGQPKANVRTVVQEHVATIGQRGWLTVREATGLLNKVVEQNFHDQERYDEPVNTPIYQAIRRGLIEAPKDALTNRRHVDPASLADWLAEYNPRTSSD